MSTDTNKHGNCLTAQMGRCLCATCDRDHPADWEAKKPACCIDHYGFYTCPVTECADYVRESKKDEN